MKLFCFFGVHEYKIIREYDLTQAGSTARGMRFVVQCTCCGKVINRDLI